tara:strand:+ start:21619 stop:23232 length:1614 start_codon:yes stop_codon:yes gene_type:complete
MQKHSMDFLSITSGKLVRELTSTDDIDKSVLYTIISLTVIIAILLLFFTWIGSTLSLNTSNCRKYKKQFDSLKQSYSYASIYKDCDNNPGLNNTLYCNNESATLRNFYIKTAYNCCNSDGYKNNWVHLCALQNALKLGARCLDFEVYSLKHQPIIASSSNANFSFKETFNYLTLEEVLDEILNTSEPNTFSDRTIETREPLLLHFRIKSEHIEMFDNMGYIINEKFYGNGENGLLTPKKGVKASENGKGVDRLPIHELSGKVIIMIDSPYKELIKNTQLHNVTNLYSGDHYKVYKRSQIDSENELLKSASKNKIHIILPDLNNKLSNYDISEPFKNGCQMMAMKFQQNDLNLRSYFDLFKNSNNRGLNSTKNASFILKHLTLRTDENIPPPHVIETTPIESPEGRNGADNINLTIKRATGSYEYPTSTPPSDKPKVMIKIDDHTTRYIMVGDETILTLSAVAGQNYKITFEVINPISEEKDTTLNVDIAQGAQVNIETLSRVGGNACSAGNPLDTYDITLRTAAHAEFSIIIKECLS